MVLPYGCYAFRPGCGIGTPTFNHRTTVPLYNRAKFRFETRCGAPGGCPTTASGFTPGNRALFSAANVSVRVDDWTTPALAPHSGALWRTGWHRGHEEAGEHAPDVPPHGGNGLCPRLVVEQVLRHGFPRTSLPIGGSMRRSFAALQGPALRTSSQAEDLELAQFARAIDRD